MRIIKKYYLYLFIAILVLLFVIWQITKSEDRVEAVSKNGVLTVACIVDVQKKKRGHRVTYIYEYKVKDKIYRRGTYFDYAFYNINYYIGEELWVLYDKDDPDISYELDYLLEKQMGLDTIRIEQDKNNFKSESSYCQ